jgi:hypothetical protein
LYRATFLRFYLEEMILRLVIIQYERSSLKPDLDVELLAVLVLVYEEPALGDHSVLLLP